MPWWKWLLLGLWILFVAFTLGWIGTNLGENELKAAGVGGIIFGLITVVLGAGLWRVIVRGWKKA
jgi:hypothetical protein